MIKKPRTPPMIENTDLNIINCGNIPNPRYKNRLAPLETPIILGSTSGVL